MKGCARSCTLWLLGWAVAAYAFYYYLVSIRDLGPPLYWGSAVAGLCVVAIVAYAFGIGSAYRERQMLLEAAVGMPPEDGKWVAVSGAIHSMASLTAPISGRDAVAYEYKIYRHERRSKNHSEVTYFEGKALAPSTIATRQGTVRLLSVPSLNDIPAQSVPWSEAWRNAKEYIARTEFELNEPGTQRKGLEEEWTDDDGQYRRDRRYHTSEVELGADFHFQERRVDQGELVCAFGLYSRHRGGLIPHPNWSTQTRLMRGDTSAVAAQLRRRIVNYCIGLVVSGAIAYGIVRLYHYNAAALS